MGRGCGEVLLLSKGTDPHSHDEKKPEKKNILLLHYVFETKARLLWGLRDQPEDKYAAAPLQTDCLKKILLLSAREEEKLETNIFRKAGEHCKQSVRLSQRLCREQQQLSEPASVEVSVPGILAAVLTPSFSCKFNFFRACRKPDLPPRR